MILIEDGDLEIAEFGRWLDAQLVNESSSRIHVELKRVALSTGPVQRQHELPTQALSKWFLGHRLSKVGDDLGMMADGQLGLCPGLEHAEPHLLEPRDRSRGEGLAAHVAESRPPPQTERRPILCRRSSDVPRLKGIGHLDERFEALGIEGISPDLELITGRASEERRRSLPVVAEDPSEPRDEDVDHLRRAGWRVSPPQIDHESLGRNRPVRVQDQVGEQRARLRAAHRDRPIVHPDLDRPKDAELDMAVPTGRNGDTGSSVAHRAAT